MKSRLWKACLSATCAAIMLAAGPRAAAESVSLVFDQSVNPGVSLSGASGGPFVQTGPFYWHDGGWPPNGSFSSPTVTFCIEVSGALPGIGQSAIFGVQSVTSDLGSAKAAALTELYGKYYNTAWNSTSFTGSADSIAFQLAVWELAIDGPPASGNSADLQNGAFTASPLIGSVETTAQNMLNSLTGDTSSFARFGNVQLVALVAPDPADPKKQDFQNQITMVPGPTTGVPAPSGIVLAGMGLIGLVSRSRFLRRKETLA
jgi:hypothetical protein